MRTYKDCLPFFQENIIDPLDPDIFIHTWENQGGITNQPSQHTDSAPRDHKIYEDELTEIYSPKKVVVEKFHEKYYDELKGVSPPEEIRNHDQYSISILPLLYKIHGCNELKKEYEKMKGDKYDVVIVTRPDIAVFSPIPDKILDSTDSIWELRSQRSNDAEVLDDMIVISSSENIDAYASAFNRCENYWQSEVSSENKICQTSAQEILYQTVVDSGIEIEQPVNMRRGTDWEIIRYGMDLSIYDKNSIIQYLHILIYGDTGIYKGKDTIHRGLCILREEGLRRFSKEFAQFVLRLIGGTN
jgi:hypothetical protein